MIFQNRIFLQVCKLNAGFIQFFQPDFILIQPVIVWRLGTNILF